MLRWRLTIGAALIAALACLCWLDAHAARPGVYLAPLALGVTSLAAAEMLRLFRARGETPLAWPIYAATLLPVMGACLPVVMSSAMMSDAAASNQRLALGLAAGIILLFLVEMWRFESPGKSIGVLAHSSLSVLYVGGLVGMLVELRGAPSGPDRLYASSIVPLLSMIAIVKASDIGQYAFGRLWGRRKLVPRLSPGKTWEGAIGGIGTATILAAVVLPLILHGGGTWHAGDALTAAAYALSLALAGLAGDLAESLLKRDAGVKDSSDWLPGFGGVLDLLDSLLFAAPVAYAWWASGLLST